MSYYAKLKARQILAGAVRGILRMLPDRLVVIIREQSGLVRALDYPDARLLLHVDSAIELRTRIQSCHREPEMLQWMQRFFKPGDVFYDIGANVGAYSLLAASLGGGRINVVAFEPGATSYAQLCRNLALNPCGQWVRPFPIALSADTKLVQFHYSDLTGGAALHSVDVAPERAVFSHTVMGIRLDDLVSMFGLPAPSHIKIDVDGGEAAVLTGAYQTLRSPSLKSVFIELEHGSADFAEVVAHLESCGLQRSESYAVSGEDRFARFRNEVFVRSNGDHSKATV